MIEPLLTRRYNGLLIHRWRQWRVQARLIAICSGDGGVKHGAVWPPMMQAYCSDGHGECSRCLKHTCSHTSTQLLHATSYHTHTNPRRCSRHSVSIWKPLIRDFCSLCASNMRILYRKRSGSGAWGNISHDSAGVLLCPLGAKSSSIHR